MNIRKIGFKTLMMLLAAVFIGVFGSYVFFQYQLSQEHQTSKALVTAALTQNHYYQVLLGLDDQANAVLVDCLNDVNCDKKKAASDIVAINTKRDSVIKQEQMALENAKKLLNN